MFFRVIFKIRRGKKKVKIVVKFFFFLFLGSMGSFGDSSSFLIYFELFSYFESEEDDGKLEGFVQIYVEIDKYFNESFGLFVVSSYGFIRQYYQVRVYSGFKNYLIVKRSYFFLIVILFIQ